MVKTIVKTGLWKSFFTRCCTAANRNSDNSFYHFPYVDNWPGIGAGLHFCLAVRNFKLQQIEYCNFRVSKPTTKENTDVCTSQICS